jgi:hypothetical protein
LSTCICGFETTPFTLNIGILGYNSELSEYGFKQIVKNNKEQIKFISSKCIAIFKDGTELRVINPNSELRGYKIDQLILFDNNKWEIYSHRNEDIRLIKTLLMFSSNIPKEFQILEYEDVR